MVSRLPPTPGFKSPNHQSDKQTKGDQGYLNLAGWHLVWATPAKMWDGFTNLPTGKLLIE